MLSPDEWHQLGAEVAKLVQEQVREQVAQALAGSMEWATAAGANYADPDGSGIQVVNVSIGGVTVRVPLQAGVTVGAGTRLLILRGGAEDPNGWLAIKGP